MYKILTITFILYLFFTACKNRTETVVTQKYDNGKPKIEITYVFKDTTKTAKSIKGYYEDGKVRFEGTFDNKKQRNGEWKYFYENKKLWSAGQYKKGLREGIGTTYYKNGKKRMEGNYKDNKKDGIWKFWSENGTLLKSVEFNEGALVKTLNPS